MSNKTETETTQRSDENPQVTFQDKSIDRREMLKRMGRYGMYAAPLVAIVLDPIESSRLAYAVT